jgi:[histone H3]-dimethyl-L-lysine9 demethylase
MRRRSTSADAPPLPDDLRCRRSNGKDWRCSQQALPDLSYCAYHHRLNYHRPPPSSTSGRRTSRKKYSSSPALGVDGNNKADLDGDRSAGSFGDGASFVRRRKRRRKESLMSFQGKNCKIREFKGQWQLD